MKQVLKAKPDWLFVIKSFQSPHCFGSKLKCAEAIDSLASAHSALPAAREAIASILFIAELLPV